MMNKRVLLLCGHYGSGKTNIAVNLAQAIKREYPTVTLADLDIVNPYFRSKDSAAELEAAGIRLICSRYANSNVDIPALPSDLYALTDDRRMRAIIDVGGDDRGALVLGRLAPALLEENNYEMMMVINCYRPLTRDAASTVEVMREIEYAGGIRFTALVNNSNLGVETTAEDVLSSMRYAEEVSAMSGLPVVMTTADERLQSELADKVPNLFSLKLQNKIQ
jgi:energy-coupling factor transporter ATP-binding protein EcfA2